MARPHFEELEVYQLAEQLADEVWAIVSRWDHLPRDTMGKPLIRAADSIGANLAEGVGRGSARENRHFAKIARGCLNEAKHWLRRAYRRGLLDQQTMGRLKSILLELQPRLKEYLKSIGPSSGGQRTSELGGPQT